MKFVFPYKNASIASQNILLLKKYDYSLIFYIILIIFFFISGPTSIGLPYQGLDPSWVQGLLWAQNAGLAFGKDIIFTFGPCHTLYTLAYSPNSGNFTLLCGIYFYITYVVAFITSNHFSKNIYTLLGLSILCLLAWERDVLMFIYILLSFLCIIKIIDLPLNFSRFFILFLLSSGLGLISLAKGSFLFTILPLNFLIICYTLFVRKIAFMFSWISGLFILPFFWLLSGQSLIYMSNWFLSLIDIVQGYNEAMSVNGQLIDYLLYLVPFITILILVFISQKKDIKKCLFIVMGLTYIFLVTFKAGFIRHDGHVLKSFYFIIIAGILICTILDKNLQKILLIEIICLCILIGTTSPYKHMYISPLQLMTNSFHGLLNRIAGNAHTIWEKHIKYLREQCSLPLLTGTSDIYSFDQTELLASGNIWNPRPIFQSYSAYTPELCRLNAQHLSGSKAPDNIFFRVQPIDNRFPAMEDGLSWPLLLDNYHVEGIFENTVLLKKKPFSSIDVSNSLVPLFVSPKIYQFDEKIFIPQRENNPIFLKLKITTNWKGKLRLTFYKPPQLYITIYLKNGKKISRRIISGMSETGFFLSPYIETTQDFFYLATKNYSKLLEKEVLYFIITQENSYLTWGDWNKCFSIEMYKYSDEKSINCQ